MSCSVDVLVMPTAQKLYQGLVDAAPIISMFMVITRLDRLSQVHHHLKVDVENKSIIMACLWLNFGVMQDSKRPIWSPY